MESFIEFLENGFIFLLCLYVFSWIVYIIDTIVEARG